MSQREKLHKLKIKSINFLSHLIWSDSKILFMKNKNNPQQPCSIFHKITKKLCRFWRSDGRLHAHSCDYMLTCICFPGFTASVRMNNYSCRVNKGICNRVPAGNLFLKSVHSLHKTQILYFILFCNYFKWFEIVVLSAPPFQTIFLWRRHTFQSLFLSGYLFGKEIFFFLSGRGRTIAACLDIG